MWHFLADLDHCVPGMWSEYFFAIITLKIGNYKLNHSALLHDCPAWRFFFNSELNFQSLRVRLCP